MGRRKVFHRTITVLKKYFFVLFETKQLKCVPVVCVYAVSFSAVIAGLYFPLFVLHGGNIRIYIYLEYYTYYLYTFTSIINFNKNVGWHEFLFVGNQNR